VAADGHQALEFTEGSNMPDLIVADYNLPNGITGLEIIARLQARAQHPIPAILLTGDISTESLRDIAGHGCVPLNKPVRAKDLTRLVQRFLAKGAAAAPDTVEQPPLGLGTRQSSTVFVVDDDQAVGEAIADLLKENGYSVQLFTDGAAFLEAAIRAPTDAFWSRADARYEWYCADRTPQI
jgi:two-component system, chemotaxis family, CheB/CheR fusion protein